MTSKITPWEPSKFDGSDLLPIAAPVNLQPLVSGVPVVGRETLEEIQVRVPWLKLIQGMSPEIQEGIPGLKPGKFYLPSTGQVIEPPIRVLGLMHNNSNSLYPKPDKPNFVDENGVPYVKCFSRDGVTGDPGNRGTTFCEDCGLASKSAWTQNPTTGKRVPPPCDPSHVFTVLLPEGPARIRCKGFSYREATNFLRMWKGAPNKNIWSHPIEIRVRGRENKEYNSTTYYMELWWTLGEAVPDEFQVKAYETWQYLTSAEDEGRLVEEDE